jgi:heme/copper-type cytochrome/quinol oxidase subunit 4
LAKDNIIALAFGLMIVFLVIAGSAWIMIYLYAKLMLR